MAESSDPAHAGAARPPPPSKSTFCAYQLAWLENRFSALSKQDPAVWLPAITNTEGEMYTRLGTLVLWRDRLLLGGAPIDASDPWPGADTAAAFAPLVERLDLPAITYRHVELCNQVLRALLWHIDRIALAQGSLSRTEAVSAAAEAFDADWESRSTELKEILRVFESLDGVQNFARFSELQGLLRDASWQAVVRAHEAMAGMPKLAQLIRQLGRSRPADQTRQQRSAKHRVSVERRQWVRREFDLELPGAGYETQGVRRSGDLARLLSSEAMQMRRPAALVGARRAKRLRRLFAARLAEHSLLTYQQRERYREPSWVLSDTSELDEQLVDRPDAIAGPLIVCVDTSSSMAGGPESVAKAVVLEAMKTAFREHRPCRVYAFSGPDELRMTDLPFDVDGMLNGAKFLAASFHGGTDIVVPIEKALDDILDGDWHDADIVIASDGEFGATRSTVDRLADAKQSMGLRVHGVLIGDRETMGLRQVADDIFWVRDWRRFGANHGQINPPLHDKGLTELYFPNADGSQAQAGE